MNHYLRTTAALLGILLLPSIAAAELRHVQISVQGMD